MLQELVLHHFGKKQKRHLFLTKQSYRIGKALDNDIVLLDSECPSYLATLKKEKNLYIWKDPSQTLDLYRNPHQIHGYSFHIQHYQQWLYALLFVGVFWISLLFFQWMYGYIQLPLAQNISLPARGVYGNVDPEHPISNVKFEFQSQPEKFSVLHYTPGNLSRQSDLEIRINQKFLSFAPASPGKWNVEISQYVSNELLNSEKNSVEFVFHGKENQPWAVKDIYVESLDEAPVQQDGKDFTRNIQKLLRERKAKKGNVVRAGQVVAQAKQYYQSRQENLPEQLQKLSSRVQEEKIKMLQDHRVLIQKYRREQEFPKAKEIYNHLMDELIDPMDPDRIQLEQNRGME